MISSLVFCTGPLTILGSLNDGLGNGGDQILLKAVLDGFAAVAFAASFGWGVAASAVTIVVIQGGLTLVGLALGDVLPDAHLAAITAAGGLLLVGRGAAAAPDPRDPGGGPAPRAAGRPRARRTRGAAALTRTGPPGPGRDDRHP